MRTRIAVLLVAAALGVGGVAKGKERGLEPLSCPVAGVLRIPDAASLRGLEVLAECGPRTVVAPASPNEYEEPRDRSIVPQTEDGVRRRMTVAERVEPDARRVGSARQLPVGAIATPEALLRLRPARYTTPHDGIISRVAERYRIDPLFLHAVIGQESAYRVQATSSAGARGLMQLMPGTARMLGIGTDAIVHPEVNVDGGARLLRRLHGRYRGDLALTLAAYNAGEGAVARYGNRVPPYAETQNYVRAVLARYQRLAADHLAVRR